MKPRAVRPTPNSSAFRCALAPPLKKRGFGGVHSGDRTNGAEAHQTYPHVEVRFRPTKPTFSSAHYNAVSSAVIARAVHTRDESLRRRTTMRPTRMMFRCLPAACAILSLTMLTESASAQVREVVVGITTTCPHEDAIEGG